MDKWEKSKLKITETYRNIDKKLTKFNKESKMNIEFFHDNTVFMSQIKYQTLKRNLS